VGRFITRIRPGDKELWDRLVEEASRLCETEAPNPAAVAHLLKIAGDNPRAFGGIGGKSTRGLSGTSEGKAVLRLLGTAAAERKLQTRVGVPRVIGRRRTAEEKLLAAMPVTQGFALLAEEEPRLLLIAVEALQAAEAGRAAGEVESVCRASIFDIYTRITATDPIIGPSASSATTGGLITTSTAVQVVWAHLASITGVSVLPLQ
jgi:hypothetical protein